MVAVHFGDFTTATASLLSDREVAVLYRNNRTIFEIVTRPQRRGIRRYFRCRKTGQKVNHLYATDAGFVSRMEAGLVYASQIGNAPVIPRKVAK
ncbi:hypothetical protein NCHU2750_17910 [Neorhizobium sp. NCHU2750]|nr:hypothetical protein NCHU2750_17910 [Neorhizobium sp. NCHU2750]